MKTPSLPKANSMDKLLRMQLWIRRIIAFLFASFLISLSISIIKDIDGAEDYISWEKFQTPEYQVLKSKIDELNKKRMSIEDQMNTARVEDNNARTDIQSFNAEYQSWLALRSATEAKETNPEVKEKLTILDNKRNIEREKKAIVTKLEAEYSDLLKEINTSNVDSNQMLSGFQEKAAAENETRSLKIFFFRLLFCTPILALGVFAFIKYRNHQYSPLIWGYVWYSVYVFFFGLVPYLPSFGGYIRYAVGLVLVFFGGIYTIKSFNSYMERRRIELEKDKDVRAKQVDSENAVAAFKAHTCPSCGQDYSIGADDINSQTHKVRNCFHCGLELFKVCDCGKLNFAFFKFCNSCGKKITESPKE